MPKTAVTTLHLRLPVDLKAQLDEAAAASGRSLNSEALSRLRHSFAIPQSDSMEAAIERYLEERGMLGAVLPVPGAKPASVESLAVLADRLRAGIERLKNPANGSKRKK